MRFNVFTFWNLLGIISAGYIISMFAGIFTYFSIKYLGFSGSFSDLIGFLAHFITIFLATTILLKLAAEKGYVAFSVPRKLVSIAIPVLAVSLTLFIAGIRLMIFPVDASLVVLAFRFASRI